MFLLVAGTGVGVFGGGLNAETGKVNIPRPCVATTKVVKFLSVKSWLMDVLGRPVRSCCQLAPPSVVKKKPTSVPMYRTGAFVGSRTIALTGVSGKLVLISDH